MHDGCMAITYQREKLSEDLWRELLPLLRLHFEEIAHYQDIELDPDFESYLAVEHAGAFRGFTARKDGELIGYAAYFVRSNMHYRQSVQAVQDVIFVHPDHRRGSVGARLIAYADGMLADEGVQAVYHHVKAKHNFGPLLERMGYEMVDLIYGKRLD